MAAEDVAVDDSSARVPEVSQDVLDNIDSVFAQADHDEVGGQGEDTAVQVTPTLAETQAAKSDPPRSMVARRAAAKEQAEELAEEEQLAQAADEENEDESADDEQADEDEVENEGDEPEAELPVVDDHLRAIAKEFGWTDERIDKLAAKDPELLNDTLEGLAEAYTNLSRQYLQPAAQQYAPPGYAVPPPQQAQPAQPQSASGLDTLFNPQGLQQFAEANGEELVKKFLEPLYQEVILPFRQMQADAVAQVQQAILTEANSAFEKLAEKDADLYGSGPSLTAAQAQARSNVARLADQMRAGARAQGRDLTVSDALTRAHLVETAERRQAEGRRQVQEQIKTRSRAITARPTQRNNARQVVRNNDTAAMDAYEERAAQLGIEV